ncbi:MAG: hypothetical protein ACKVQV_15360 [Bacteroidia bacterium]
MKRSVNIKDVSVIKDLFEGLSGLKSNILDCVNLLKEYNTNCFDKIEEKKILIQEATRISRANLINCENDYDSAIGSLSICQSSTRNFYQEDDGEDSCVEYIPDCSYEEDAVDKTSIALSKATEEYNYRESNSNDFSILYSSHEEKQIDFNHFLKHNLNNFIEIKLQESITKTMEFYNMYQNIPNIASTPFKQNLNTSIVTKDIDKKSTNFIDVGKQGSPSISRELLDSKHSSKQQEGSTISDPQLNLSTIENSIQNNSNLSTGSKNFKTSNELGRIGENKLFDVLKSIVGELNITQQDKSISDIEPDCDINGFEQDFYDTGDKIYRNPDFLVKCGTVNILLDSKYINSNTTLELGQIEAYSSAVENGHINLKNSTFIVHGAIYVFGDENVALKNFELLNENFLETAYTLGDSLHILVKDDDNLFHNFEMTTYDDLENYFKSYGINSDSSIDSKDDLDSKDTNDNSSLDNNLTTT